MSSSARLSQFAPQFQRGVRRLLGNSPRTGTSWTIALGGLIASLCIALPCAAQQRMGGSGGGSGSGGTGGSGTGGSGTGGSSTGGSGGGTGGSSMTGAGGALDEPGAQCTSEPHEECPDRCPTFASCFVAAAMGREAHLYYRVDEQRLACDGLDCVAAAERLADYCCERGEFAPSKDDGGGCELSRAGVAANAGGSESAAPWLGLGLGLCAAGVGRYRRRRARR
jgi:hypothetical protein